MEEGHPSLYLVYDYMDGGDLARALASDPPALTERQLVKVSEGVPVGWAQGSACVREWAGSKWSRSAPVR